VAGQPTITYTYDNANRLQTIQQGATTVTYGYDNADRRTSVTLPNGLVVETGYDLASRVTSLTYRQGAAVLGDLTYTYNLAGERVSIGGTSVTHDLNWNLTGDGATTLA
jgi:YD repeat-containing protein